MLEFCRPKLEDKAWVDEVLMRSRHMGCIYNFGQLYLWSERYGTRICRYKDCLLTMAGGDRPLYIYPAGSYDITEIVELLKADSIEREITLKFAAAEEWQMEELVAAFPGRFECTESRDDFDYIYKAEDLINLAGRKYHGKRNHISKFTRVHPDWSYENIDDGNAGECAAAADEWRGEPDKTDDESLKLENRIIKRALAERRELDIAGGLIRTEGKVVAFTLGERLNEDIYDMHFEKALAGYEEAYTVINREFAAHNLTGYKYINREEDMGVEGLRKAKLSYQPEILLKKYTIVER